MPLRVLSKVEVVADIDSGLLAQRRTNNASLTDIFNRR